MNQFNKLNIESTILKGIQEMQFEEMTEVQENVIPFALEGFDIIAQAPTGTGKTCAYAIPLLQSVDCDNPEIQMLVLAPTRELVVQIKDEITEISKYKEKVRIVAIYGGEYIERQITSLKRKPQIIVATPGRLMDHMERKTIRIDDLKVLVLDEADEMLNMGFKEDIDEILKSVKSDHQTMLFSATISKDIEHLGKTYLNEPKIVRVNKNEFNVPAITQKYVDVKEKDKIEVMSRLIDIHNYKLVMVFCNTKRMVDEVTSALLMRGFIVEALHGDMKQMQRDRVMNRFRTGAINILVASDVAARGLDIDDVDVVFNYDVPTDEEYYVHRIGRTGRAKKEGLAVTLVTKQEKYRLRSIVAYSKAEIESMDVPSLEKVMKVRIERVIKQALEIKQEKHKVMIEKMLESSLTADVDATDLISGLIMMQLSEAAEDIVDTPKRSKKGVTRMFITLGKKDHMRIFHLTDLLVKKTHLTNADINNVEMLESFSFFEIPSSFVDEVMAAFAIPDQGRRIVVEEASAKQSDGERPKRERKRHDEDRQVNENPNDNQNESNGRSEYKKKKSYESKDNSSRSYPSSKRSSEKKSSYAPSRDRKRSETTSAKRDKSKKETYSTSKKYQSKIK